jgi:rubrerythrin
MAVHPGTQDLQAASLGEWEEHLLTYGLSEWERDLLHHFREHTATEAEFLDGYSKLAESTSDEFVRYLVTLILEDERRHHRMFQELANSVVGEANLARIHPSVPDVALAHDAKALREATTRYLRHEEQDQRELRRLRKALKPVRESTLWDLLIALAELDTRKHRLILTFLRDRAAESARSSRRRSSEQHRRQQA